MLATQAVKIRTNTVSDDAAKKARDELRRQLGECILSTTNYLHALTRYNDTLAAEGARAPRAGSRTAAAAAPGRRRLVSKSVTRRCPQCGKPCDRAQLRDRKATFWVCLPCKMAWLETSSLANDVETSVTIPSTGSAAQTSLGPCRTCGCTDDRACPGGCYWVEPGLCSRCDEGLRATDGRETYDRRS